MMDRYMVGNLTDEWRRAWSRYNGPDLLIILHTVT